MDEFEAMNNTAHNYWSVGHYVGFLLDRLLKICEYGATSVNDDEIFIPMPAVAAITAVFAERPGNWSVRLMGTVPYRAIQSDM